MMATMTPYRRKLTSFLANVRRRVTPKAEGTRKQRVLLDKLNLDLVAELLILIGVIVIGVIAMLKGFK